MKMYLKDLFIGIIVKKGFDKIQRIYYPRAMPKYCIYFNKVNVVYIEYE